MDIVQPSKSPSNPGVADPVLDQARTLASRLQTVSDESATNPLSAAQLLRVLATASSLIRTQMGRGELRSDEAFELVDTAFVLHRLLRSRGIDERDSEVPEQSPNQQQLEVVLHEVAASLCLDVGFERVMAFRVGGGLLNPVATVFAQDPDWAADVHSQAIIAPPALDLAVLESAVVDAQRCLVVEDPQHDNRTWKPVIQPLDTQSYVSAPIVVDGLTVATIHSDRWFSKRAVTEHDRDMLGLVAQEASRTLANVRRTPRVADQNRSPLSVRQQEVMQQVAAGATNAETAAALFVSPETVKSHLKSIYQTLGVKNRAQAVDHFRS